MTALHTMDEVAERVHKSRRWLQSFVREHRIGRLAGRKVIFTDTDVAHLNAAIRKVAEERFNATPRSEGHVYFIESGEFIKIGYTRSPVARVRKMLTDTPIAPHLLHAEPGSFKQEKLFHRHFAAIRSRGEWFQKTPELLAFIEQRKRLKEG